MTSKRGSLWRHCSYFQGSSGQCRIIDGGRVFRRVTSSRMERWDVPPAKTTQRMLRSSLIVVSRLKAQPPPVPRWTQQKHPSLILSPPQPPSPVYHHHHHGLDTVETLRFLVGVGVLGICCTSDEYDSG